jgi:outer membrane immunogenic protein
VLDLSWFSVVEFGVERDARSCDMSRHFRNAVLVLALSLAGLTPPAAAQGRNWSGFYVGAHAGYAWSDMGAADVLAPFGGFFTPLGPAAGQGFAFEADGFIGGGQIGVQHQFGGFLLGAEVSYSATSLEQSINSPFFASDRERMSLDGLLLATARLGVVTGDWLWYLKGGYAGGDAAFHASDNVSLVDYSQSSWHNGWTVGGGFEYAFGSNVTLGIEYNYVDLGSVTKSGLASDGFDERYRLDAEAHAVTARLSYLFGRAPKAPRPYPMK